ncbi:MAG: prolyl oligopeptidase family serine peptidase [Ilumatobacter sp.]
MAPIPLSMVKAGRDITEPRVSPDGEHVAFTQRVGGSAGINVVSLRGGEPERPLSFGIDPLPGRGLGGGAFTWVVEARGEPSIVYVGRDGELWRQRGVESDRLTAHGRGTRAPAVADRRSTRHPNLVLAYVVDEAEVWVLDLSTGSTERLDDGRHAFCFDPAVAPGEHTVSWQAWSPPSMAWDASVRVDADLASRVVTETAVANGAIQQPRFTPEGIATHVHDGGGWLNVHVDGEPIVAEPCEHAGPTWGMGNRSYAFDDDGERMAFTRNEAGHGALWVVDLSSGIVDRLGRGVHGHLSWVGESLVAIRSGARTPTCVVAYDMATRERSTLAHAQPTAWSWVDLPEPELIEIADGDAVLYARRFVAGAGRMLAWVHGGPTDQWQVDWRPRISYWWSRGWDVLVVDPRGTTGHGRAYQQALHGAWGRLDVDDTAAMLRHAHRAAWATPASTAIIGGSSGGLTVLGVLADHGELVAGGVASYPVSDLRALTEVTHRFEAHYTDTLVAPNDGSAASDAAFERLSPLHRAERIDSPVLVFHGAEDVVVPISQSRELVRRIEAAGGDIEFVVFDGEGHGFRDVGNVEEEYRRTEDFLDRLIRRSESD